MKELQAFCDINNVNLKCSPGLIVAQTKRGQIFKRGYSAISYHSTEATARQDMEAKEMLYDLTIYFKYGRKTYE